MKLRGFLVTFRIDFAGSHVDFLEPNAVEMGLWFGDDGDANLIDVRFSKECVERIGTTTATAPNRDSIQVDVRLHLAKFLDRIGLVFGG